MISKLKKLKAYTVDEIINSIFTDQQVEEYHRGKADKEMRHRMNTMKYQVKKGAVTLDTKIKFIEDLGYERVQELLYRSQLKKIKADAKIAASEESVGDN